MSVKKLRKKKNKRPFKTHMLEEDSSEAKENNQMAIRQVKRTKSQKT